MDRQGVAAQNRFDIFSEQGGDSDGSDSYDLFTLSEQEAKLQDSHGNLGGSENRGLGEAPISLPIADPHKAPMACPGPLL